MAVQMYLIHPKNTEDEAARENLGEFVFRRGGYILMATSHGSLIVAMDALRCEIERVIAICAHSSSIGVRHSAGRPLHLHSCASKQTPASLW